MGHVLDMAPFQWRPLVLNRLDLRFPDKLTEVSFVQSLEKRLLYASVACCAFCMFGTSLTYLMVGVPDSGNSARTYKAMSGCVCFFFFPLVFIFLALVLLKCNFSKVINTELTVTSCYAIFCICVPWTTDWIAAELHGLDPVDAFGEDTRAHELYSVLTLDAATSILNMFIPLRVRYKWFPPMCGITSFIVSVMVFPTGFPSITLLSTFTLFLVTFCALCGAWQNEQVARQRFTSERIVQKSTGQLELQHESSSRILERLCDTLLHLDTGFCIIDREPRFEALLLCGDRDSIKTDNFLDFLASDHDRTLFTSALVGRVDGATDIQDSKIGGLVQVNLCDMHGREFPVYLYHASIYDLESKCGHMVALVEVQERNAPVPDLSHMPHATIPVFESTRGYEIPDLLPLESCSDWVNEERSEESESLIESETSCTTWQECQDNLAIWINMNSPRLQIEQCSIGFTIFGPLAQGTGFLDLLVSNKCEKRRLEKKFEAWILDAIERLLSDADHNPSIVSNASLRLRICNASHCSNVYDMTCKIDIESKIPLELALTSRCMVRLVFSDVSLRSRKKCCVVDNGPSGERE